MILSQTPPDVRHFTRNFAAEAFNTLEGEKTRGDIIGLKKDMTPLLKNALRQRLENQGYNSIIATILIGVMVKLAANLLWYWFKKKFLSAPQGYQQGEPGYVPSNG